MKQWETVRMKLSDLTPAAYNPRDISERALQGLESSIERFGLVQPIVWNKRTGNIVGGHQRMKALLAAGQTEVDVTVVDFDSNDEMALNVALNNPEIQGDFTDNIGAILKTIHKSSEELFDNLRMDDLAKSLKISLEEHTTTGNEDDIPETPKISVSVIGDFYKLGNHKLYCGDSSDKDAVEFLMEGKKAVLVFTDPPYGVSIGKKNVMLNEHVAGKRNQDNLEMDDMGSEELAPLLLKIFTLWYDYMGDDCSVFICFPLSGELGPLMLDVMQKVGLKNRHILNWVKNNATFSMGRLDYDYKHEPIFFTWKHTHKRKKEGQFQNSLWEVDKPMSSKEHPTMKPVELPVGAIMNHTDEGDIVADMFGGSGTTLIAAEKTNRIARTCEISPFYCDVIRRRWAEYVHGKGCDWEKLTPKVKV